MHTMQNSDSNNNKRNNNDSDDNILKEQKLNNNNEEVGGSEIDITNLTNQTVIHKQVIEFKIKDNIDPLEWLFWEVFRNIFLYKQIMSNMDTNSSIHYHSIISTTNMIKCNQLNLLRDKVIRNQYLTFGGKRNKFNEIFSAIRNNNDQDRLFYQQLFKYYGQYSMAFNNVMVEDNYLIDIECGRELLVNDIITANCIPALQVLIQQYQFKPTIGILQQAIICKRFKLVKLLLSSVVTESRVNLKINNLDQYVLNVKILNYFYDEKLLDSKLVVKIISNYSSKIECITLKSLIGISKLILKYINQNDGGSCINIVTVEDIETFSNNLTKPELKSTLSDKSNQIKPKKEMIKKLLQLLYSFLNVKKSQFYYIYFSGGETYTDSDIGTIQTPTEAYKSFLRFADIKLLPPLFNQSVDNSSSHIISNHFRECKSREPELLFSYCQDKEKQMKFIKEVTLDLKGIYKQKRLGIVDPFLFFHLLLYNDDLDQIKYVANELNIKEIIADEQEDYIIITKYIKSTLVLEWLFENCYITNTSIWYFNSVELLQHYEKIYHIKCKYDGLIDISIPRYYGNGDKYEPPINIEIIKHIFKSGSTVYYDKRREGSENLFLFIINQSEYSQNDRFELLKLLYTNFYGIVQLTDFLESKDLNESFQLCFIKFIHWFYRNYQDECNNSNYLKENYVFGLILLKSDLLVNERTNDFYLHFILSSANEINTQYMDLALQCTTSINYKELVSYLMLDACETGKLNTLKYIHQNYNWLLVKKSNTNTNGLFTTRDLNLFLVKSIEKDQLVISDYLFDLFSITKKQFDSNSGPLSKLYYKNKSFK